MPVYNVRAPDGTEFEVEAPEGATKDQVLAYAQQHYQQQSSGSAKAPTRLSQIEQALRKADAAGNTEDARTLANAYREERDRSAAPRYSEDELFQKLQRADEAGDVEAARVIADEIRRQQRRGAAVNVPRPSQATKRAQLPDGTILEFPDETPDDVMDRAVRAHLQGAPHGDFSQVQGSADTKPAGHGTIGRELGLGGRAMLEGIGSTLGIVSDPIAYGAGKVLDSIFPQQQTLSGLVTGEQPQERRFATAREGASSLADLLRLPTPQTGSERVGGQITEALAGGGGLIGVGRSLATRAPGIGQSAGEFLSAMPGSQLASLIGGSGAAGVTREAGGGSGAQTIAGLLGGLGGPFGIASGQAAFRGVARGGESGRQQMANTIGAFRTVGANPSIGQATGNRRAQGLESLLAGAPTSASRMGNFAERQAEDIGQGLQRRADKFMPNASAERAGRAVERGMDGFAQDVRTNRTALYDRADQLIPRGTVIPLSNTTAALGALTRIPAGAPGTGAALVNQEIRGIAERMSEDLARSKARSPFSGAGVQLQPGIDFETVRAIRTRIGEELTGFSLAPDRPTAQYRRLYAALSQDLEEAASQQGPAAEAAMRRANTYTRASSERLEQVQRVVDRNGGPEKVYQAVMAGTHDGGTTLRAVMQSLPEDGQRAVTAAVIKRMGLATPGQQGATGEVFSAQTFLTNWNRISPEARRALFDRHGPQFARDMDKIAQVAERIRTGSKVFANPSGTANRAAALGYYGGLAGTAGAAAMGVGAGPLAMLLMGGISANVAARVMTNPRLVAWLARTTEMPVSVLPQQLVILKQSGDADAAELAAELERQQRVDQQGNRR